MSTVFVFTFDNREDAERKRLEHANPFSDDVVLGPERVERMYAKGALQGSCRDCWVVIVKHE